MGLFLALVRVFHRGIVRVTGNDRLIGYKAVFEENRGIIFVLPLSIASQACLSVYSLGIDTFFAIEIERARGWAF